MWRLVVVLAILSTSANAQDYIPQLSTTTGQEIGRAFRTDGKVPTKEGARNDRHDTKSRSKRPSDLRCWPRAKRLCSAR